MFTKLNPKSAVRVAIPVVLLSAITGMAAVPSAFAAEASAPVSASAPNLKSTMADRVYLLGGPTAHGVGSLANAAAMFTDAEGNTYTAGNTSNEKVSQFEVYKVDAKGGEATAYTTIGFDTGFAKIDMSSLRIAIGKNGLVYAAFKLAEANGDMYWDLVVRDPKKPVGVTSSVTIPIKSMDVQTGGIALGTIGKRSVLAYSLDQQIDYTNVKDDGMLYGWERVAGVEGTAGFAGDGQAVDTKTTEFNDPQGLAFDRNGNLLVADAGNNRVRQLTGVQELAPAKINTIAGNGNAAYSGDGQPAIDGAFNHPTAVAVDAKNNVYVADTDNGKIRVLDGYRTAATVIGSSQDPQGTLTPGVIAPNAPLYNPRYVGIKADGSIVLSSASQAEKAVTGWQSAPLAGIDLRADILPAWVGAAPNSSALLSPRGEAAGRKKYSMQMPSDPLQLSPSADGTKWVTDEEITLMTQGENGAPFTITADAKGHDKSESNVSAEYWVTNPVTFSNVLLFHDVRISYKASDGHTYSSMLPNGLSIAYVRGYNQSYVGQSPDTPMTWGDFTVPLLSRRDGDMMFPYIPSAAKGDPVIQGDWIMNLGLTLQPQYN